MHENRQRTVMTDTPSLRLWFQSAAWWDMIQTIIKRHTKGRVDDDTLHDFWIVLYEKANNDVHLHAAVGDGNLPAIESKIIYHFTNFVREQHRDRLYQRVRHVLSQSNDLGYHKRAGYPAYGNPHGRPMPSYHDIKNQCHFKAPPFSAIEIKKSDTIRNIAMSFLLQVQECLGFTPSIHVRDFCAFLRDHYDTTHYQEEALPEEKEPSPAHTEEHWDPLETIGEDIHYAAALTWSRLEHIVHAAAGSLADQEAKVLCYLEYCGWRMEDAARAMGYAAASGISRIKTRAYLTLRQFLEAHAGLSEPDLDPALFDAFRSQLFHLLCGHMDCHALPGAS